MNENADIIIELIGGEDGIALEVVESALKAGKNVITANKALIAKNGNRLLELAEKNGAKLLFEAAIAGSIPIVNGFFTNFSLFYFCLIWIFNRNFE